MVVVSRRSSEQTAVDRLDCRDGRTTQLAIVHYHLNRGGVTQVIINQLARPRPGSPDGTPLASRSRV